MLECLFYEKKSYSNLSKLLKIILINVSLIVQEKWDSNMIIIKDLFKLKNN